MNSRWLPLICERMDCNCDTQSAKSDENGIPPKWPCHVDHKLLKCWFNFQRNLRKVKKLELTEFSELGDDKSECGLMGSSWQTDSSLYPEGQKETLTYWGNQRDRFLTHVGDGTLNSLLFDVLCTGDSLWLWKCSINFLSAKRWILWLDGLDRNSCNATVSTCVCFLKKVK